MAEGRTLKKGEGRGRKGDGKEDGVLGRKKLAKAWERKKRPREKYWN